MSENNVVSLHGHMRVSRPSEQTAKAYVPITALLYALVIYGGLKKDPEKLMAVRDVFAAGLLVDSDNLTALVPTQLAVWIDQFSPEAYGQAAAVMQLMYDGRSVTDVCEAVTD